jgi:hypothetical protein
MSVRDLPTVRIPNGWRVFFVYDADGTLLGEHAGYHEEAARREIARHFTLDHETLKAETKKRPE